VDQSQVRFHVLAPDLVCVRAAAGPSMKKHLGRYADLAGRVLMPPEWALGNQQSRWTYYPDTLAEEVVRRYRAEDLRAGTPGASRTPPHSRRSCGRRA
jgi:alpha-glucosidase (family GH31 glycosyl hydrolase)